MNRTSIIWPATILIGSVIVGGSIFASQLSKQHSIERQQQIDLQVNVNAQRSKAEAENANIAATQAEQNYQKEQDNKNYIAKRKAECDTVYSNETKRYNNVVGVKYSELRDVCIVTYQSADKQRSDAECQQVLANIQKSGLFTNTSIDSPLKEMAFQPYTDCLNNNFSKDF